MPMDRALRHQLLRYLPRHLFCARETPFFQRLVLATYLLVTRGLLCPKQDTWGAPHSTGVRQFAAKCGASIPEALKRRFETVDPESEDHARISSECGIEQIDDLTRRGVRNFHFYTMNQSRLTETVCRSTLAPPASDKDAA